MVALGNTSVSLLNGVGSVLDQNYNAATNTFTAHVQVANPNNGYLWLQFNGSTRGSAGGGGPGTRHVLGWVLKA